MGRSKDIENFDKKCKTELSTGTIVAIVMAALIVVFIIGYLLGNATKQVRMV